ncbi:MAG: hypothetical protein JJU07_06310 [Natronohydrobacter sp.]|nr:hypothetical protein [Natronohydrobacter sp.]
MKRKAYLFAGLLGLMGSSALASTLSFSEIDVRADLTTIQDPQAATFWNTLEDDLESAILVLLADQIAEEGARLVVDMAEFGSDESLQPDAVEAFELSGRIHVIDLNNNANFNSFELSVRLEGLTATNEDGSEVAVAQMSPEMAYETLVAAFAENIVERLD